MRGGDMESTLAPNRTASAICGRIVKPDRGTLTPELARAILKLDFDPEDHERVGILSATAQKGTLTPEERAEPEEYIRVNHEVTLLQSKARLSLERADRSSRRKPCSGESGRGPAIGANPANSPSPPHGSVTRLTTSSQSNMRGTATPRTSR